MYSCWKKNGIILIFSIVVFFLFVLPAVEAATLRLDQTKIRISALPGQAKNGEIRVDNPTDNIIHVKVYPEDWRYAAARDGTKEFNLADATVFSCANWISFFPSEFDLAPFGRQTVNYTVKIPSDVTGGHYAVLFFESMLGDAGRRESVGMNLLVRLGVIFYVEPEGTIKRQVVINGLDFSKTKEGFLSISVNFKNIGNVDLLCSSTYNIIDKQGKVYARGAFNDAYTLPGDAAKLTGTWSEPIPNGPYDIVLTFDLSKAPGQEGPLAGSVITKEAEIKVADGQISKIGELN